MPRKLDTCMFCMASPCECEGTAKPKQKKKAAGLPQQLPDLSDLRPEPLKRPDIKAAMRAAVSNGNVSKVSGVRTNPEDSGASLEFAAAINALAPILHADEHKRFAHILGRPDSRAARWKARNGRERN